MTITAAYEVAVLAGGEGTRLRQRTGALPKPMVTIAGSPLLDHQIALCQRHGFTRILLLLRHNADAIRSHFGDGSAFGASLGYEIEAVPRGTAGAIRDALPHLERTFLVLYGDTYLDVDLRRLRDAHARHNADATLFVHPNDHPDDSDLVELDKAGFITALHPHPHQEGRDYHNLASAALFVLERAGLDEIVAADEPADLARHALPAMLRAGRRLHGYVSPEYIKDIGTPERLDQAERDIKGGVPERLSARGLRSAVFLDRDGTLIRDVDDLSRPDQVELLDGVARAVRRLNRAGRLAVMMTDAADAINRRLEMLMGRAGAYLDRMGAIDAACTDLHIDRTASWLAGDATSDVDTGRRAGLKTLLVRTGSAGQDGSCPFHPDYVVADLEGAVSWILEGHAEVSRRMAPVAQAAVAARLVVVGGLARAGKSSAAQVLREAMRAAGRTAHILSFDSWLKPGAERTEGTGVASRFDVDGLMAAVRAVTPSTGRHDLQVPIYDRGGRVMYERSVPMSIGPDDLIIVEGVPALLVDELVALADLRVHVEMPEPQRLARLRADYRWRREPDAAVDSLLASRAVDEAPAVTSARTRADFVVEAWAPA